MHSHWWDKTNTSYMDYICKICLYFSRPPSSFYLWCKLVKQYLLQKTTYLIHILRKIKYILIKYLNIANLNLNIRIFNLKNIHTCTRHVSSNQMNMHFKLTQGRNYGLLVSIKCIVGVVLLFQSNDSCINARFKGPVSQLAVIYM